MATKLAESIPFLRNLRPKLGISGLVVPSSGLAADESLIIPEVAPLKIPVNGW